MSQNSDHSISFLNFHCIKMKVKKMMKEKVDVMIKVFFILGAINAGLSVALGAFGAHGLEGKVSEYSMDIWEKAVTYQMFHSVGLFIVALTANRGTSNRLLTSSGWAMFLGIVLFSGSLYVLSLTEIFKLGLITPFGGVSFIVGWVLLALAVYRK